jgi:hypothetical protein
MANDADTWLHVLFKCTHSIIHGLRIKRHNKAVWELSKLLVSNSHTRCFILMNASTFYNCPPDNTVLLIIPKWLLPCQCQSSRCQCSSHLRLNILCLIGHPYGTTPPTRPSPNISIQIIEFTYCNDRFSPTTVLKKWKNINPLLMILFTMAGM